MKKALKCKYIPLLFSLVSILAVILFMVLPMIVIKTEVTALGKTVFSETTYKGVGMIFGGSAEAFAKTTVDKTTTTKTDTIPEIKFNGLAFVAFLLVVLGVVAQIVTVFVKKVEQIKLVPLVASALVLVGGILMFCVKGSAGAALEFDKDLMEYVHLGSGPIVAGILACLAGACGIALPVLKAKK